MSKDFSNDQGGIQSSTSTEFDPIEAVTPTTGFTQSPASERPKGGPGPGIPANTRTIK